MPAANINILQSDLDKFNATLGYYVGALNLNVEEELLNQGRLLAEQLIKTTPPKKQAGTKKRIKSDINKAMRLIDPDKMTNKELKNRLKKLRRQKDYDAATKIYESSNKLKNYEFERFDKKYHETERLKHGEQLRVRTPTDKATLDKRDHNRYVREVQSRVGRLKATWLPAAITLGATVPKWVSKHALYGYSVGTCIVNFQGDVKYIYIGNRAEPEPMLRRFLKNALSGRQQAMLKSMEVQMKKSFRQARQRTRR